MAEPEERPSSNLPLRVLLSPAEHVARATYLRLPADAILWLREREFERADQALLGPYLS